MRQKYVLSDVGVRIALTKSPSNLAKAASNALLRFFGVAKSGLSVSWAHKNLRTKQDLNPFSSFCTLKPLTNLSYIWGKLLQLRDKQTDRNIGSNSQHLFHSMQPQPKTDTKQN